MQTVTGIGGVMIKARDPKKLKAWYEEHLDLSFANGYAEFTGPGTTVFNIVTADSSDFEPSKKEFMLNFRVTGLEALLAKLKESGVEVVGEIAKYDFGSFGHILDPEGNKIELWEPADA